MKQLCAVKACPVCNKHGMQFHQGNCTFGASFYGLAAKWVVLAGVAQHHMTTMSSTTVPPRSVCFPRLLLLQSVLVLVLLSATCSCQDVFSAARKLRTTTPGNGAVKYLVSDLVPLVHAAMERVSQQLVDGTIDPSLEPCARNLTALVTTEQEVHLIGNKTLRVAAIALVLDAAGKPPAGLFQGAYAFRGNLEECQMINVSSIDMRYCYLTMTLISSFTKQVAFPPLSEELCLPSTCDSDAINAFLETLNDTLRNNSIPLHIDANSTSFISLSMADQPLTTEAIVMIAVCCVIVMLVAIGTIVELLQPLVAAWKETKKQEDRIDGMANKDFSVSDSDTYSSTEIVPFLGGSRRPGFGEKVCTFCYDAITAFSLYKNVPAILATKQPPAAINSLNGLRVISMFWVILCHSFLFFFFTFGDPGTTNNARNIVHLGYKVIPRYISQVIINGFLSVDSFFFLSGVLVSYLTLREMKRRKGTFPLVPYYLHRILRLTPTYMFVLFFYWFFTMYLAQGTPSYGVGRGPNSTAWENCAKYWWTNLLYINNLYPQQFLSQCMGWSWYLANDMQFFVISPLIIVPLYLWFTGGLIVSGVLLVVSFAVTAFITGYYQLTASQFFPLAHGDYLPPGIVPDYSSQIYSKPYCRIGPYIVGLVLGAIFYHNKKPSFPPIVNYLVYFSMWACAVGVAIPTVYGLQDGFYGHVFSQAENVLYTTFARTGWGVALALLIYACHNGYGGPINSFLSLPMWVPLSRLTFNAYLVHPIILDAMNGSQRDTIYYTDITFVPYIIGSVVLSYGAAGIVSALIEFPVANVEMAFFKLLGLQLRGGSAKQPNAIKSDKNGLVRSIN